MNRRKARDKVCCSDFVGLSAKKDWILPQLLSSPKMLEGLNIVQNYEKRVQEKKKALSLRLSLLKDQMKLTTRPSGSGLLGYNLLTLKLEK